MSNEKSLKDRIKILDDIEKVIIDVLGWKGIKVQVQSMTGAARARILNDSIIDGQVDNKKLYPSVIIECCFDPKTGEKLFDESDISWLMEKNAKAIEFLAQKGISISGLIPSFETDTEKN